jgi:hypothetical protein
MASLSWLSRLDMGGNRALKIICADERLASANPKTCSFRSRQRRVAGPSTRPTVVILKSSASARDALHEGEPLSINCSSASRISRLRPVFLILFEQQLPSSGDQCQSQGIRGYRDPIYRYLRYRQRPPVGRVRTSECERLSIKIADNAYFSPAAMNTHLQRVTQQSPSRSFKPPNLPRDWATGQLLRRLPRRATHHMQGSKRNTDQAARQIVTFVEGVASAERS